MRNKILAILTTQPKRVRLKELIRKGIVFMKIKKMLKKIWFVKKLKKMDLEDRISISNKLTLTAAILMIVAVVFTIISITVSLVLFLTAMSLIIIAEMFDWLVNDDVLPREIEWWE